MLRIAVRWRVSSRNSPLRALHTTESKRNVVYANGNAEPLAQVAKVVAQENHDIASMDALLKVVREWFCRLIC